MHQITIRQATIDDAKELLDIYRPYVKNTAVTFEYDVPTLEEFKERIAKTLIKYPYLLAIKDNEIVGYAYANTFKNRQAYDWAVEVSIYIHQDKRKMGIGKLLYQKLEAILKLQNIINLYACIAYVEKEDDYLTNNSFLFHQHLGYNLIGQFHFCGYKFDRWYDMVWMEKMIGQHQDNQTSIIPFSKLDEDLLTKIINGD